MARQEIDKESIRKLQKTGRDGESYAITLPKDLVKRLKWRQGQKLQVRLRGKELIIVDWVD